MRKHNRKFISKVDSHILSPSPVESSIRSDTTAPPSTKPSHWRSKRTESTFSFTVESHLTILPKVELSKKRVSILLEQEIVRVNTEGFTLLDYFTFEWMMNYLIGSSNIHEANGKKMSNVVYVAHLILLSYRDNWNFLLKSSPIHQELSNWICENFGILSDRKYQGRNSLYQLEKFLMVKIEQVDSFLERSKTSVRYTSYCKGYGEGGRSVRRQITRYNFELDRDDSESTPLEFFSFWTETHHLEDLFLLEQIIREEKKEKR